MNFTREARTDVDTVEASFVEYKRRHPEEDVKLLDHFIVSSAYKEDLQPFVSQVSQTDLLQARQLAPWGYSFQISEDVSTDSIDTANQTAIVAGGRNDLLLRLSMLRYIFDRFDIRGEWVDVATNCGVIPLILARNFDGCVSASDFASVNIRKANFLKRLCGDEKCTFSILDAFQHLRSVDEASCDFISALGIFYHLSNPIELIELMYRASRSWILIDTIVHNFAFSGWIQTISRHLKYPHLSHANDTRKILELHPTYRGLIDALYQTGFAEVVEVLPDNGLLECFPDTIYHTRNRRMLLARKA